MNGDGKGTRETEREYNSTHTHTHTRTHTSQSTKKLRIEEGLLLAKEDNPGLTDFDQDRLL